MANVEGENHPDLQYNGEGVGENLHTGPLPAKFTDAEHGLSKVYESYHDMRRLI